MKRAALAALLAASLSGCIDHDKELVVENRGSEPVLVDVTQEHDPWSFQQDDHWNFELDGFLSWVGRFASVESVQLIVRRKSDGALLYANEFSLGDFEAFDKHIVVPVYP